MLYPANSQQAVRIVPTQSRTLLEFM